MRRFFKTMKFQGRNERGGISGIARRAAVAGLAVGAVFFSASMVGAETRPQETRGSYPVVENPVVKLEATEKNFPYVISVVQKVQKGGGARASNTLAITRVRGTRPKIEPGGTYWIEGKYTLVSEDKARLTMILSTEQHVTVRHNPTHRINVERGNGTFSFLTELTTRGTYRVEWALIEKEGHVPQAGSVWFSDK